MCKEVLPGIEIDSFNLVKRLVIKYGNHYAVITKVTDVPETETIQVVLVTHSLHCPMPEQFEERSHYCDKITVVGAIGKHADLRDATEVLDALRAFVGAHEVR